MERREIRKGEERDMRIEGRKIRRKVKRERGEWREGKD